MYAERLIVPLICIFSLCSLLSTESKASALRDAESIHHQANTDGVPGLLQFAESWKQNEPHDATSVVEPAKKLHQPSGEKNPVNIKGGKNSVRIKELELQNSKLKIEIAKVNAEKDQLTAAAKDKDNEANIYANQRDLESKLQLANQTIAKLNAVIENKSATGNVERASNEKINDLQAQLTKSKSSFTEAEKKSQQFELRVAELIHENETLKKSNINNTSNKDKELEQLRKKNIQLEAALVGSLGDTKQVATENQTLKNQIKKISASTKKSEELTTQLYALTEKMNAAESNFKSVSVENTNIKNDIQSKIESLSKRTKEIEALKAELSVLQAQEQNTRENLAKEQKLNLSFQEQLKVAQDTVTKEKQKAEELSKKPSHNNSIIELKTDLARQSYAAGVVMGQDVLSLQAERKLQGLNVDSDTVLAGLSDVFNKRVKLNQTELENVLADTDKNLAKSLKRVIEEQHKSGNQFIKNFSKQKNAKKSPDGFWYKIDYEGDGNINADDTVDIVVVEKLTDGTIVQDMESSGGIASQKRDKFPELFRAALKLVKNHGTITVVSPPELAYGDKGWAPTIPPGATMVYTIRVSDVKK